MTILLSGIRAGKFQIVAWPGGRAFLGDKMEIADGGMHYTVDKWKMVRALDSQKPYKKAIYGSAVLVSKQKAEKEKQEKNIEWKLSDREKNIVEKIGELEGPDRC